MKRNVFLGTLIALMLCLSLTLCGSASPDGNISADETEFVELDVDAPDSLNYLESVYSLRAVKDILGNDGEEGDVELLYNANDEAEYILTTAEEGGYAIFHRMTGSLMEAGEFGASPYAGQTGKKYYFGPSNYAVEGLSGSKTDIMRGGEMTEAQLTAMHRNMAEIRSLVVERSATKNYSSMLSSLQTARNEEQVASTNARSIPTIGDWHFYEDEVDVNNFIEVANSEFYKMLTNNCLFGNNTHGSCIFISMLLLLRYYDMFEAPGLLPNETIPQEWIDFCSGNDIPEILDDENTEPFSCVIQSSDSIYEAAHKYLIALEFQGETMETPGVQFGLDGYNMSNYNNTLPECTNVSTVNGYLDPVELFSFIQSAIDNNDPIGIGIEYIKQGAIDISGHAIVAYGYFDAGDVEYYKVHMGWGNFSSIILPWYFAEGDYHLLSVQDNHSNNSPKCENIVCTKKNRNQQVVCFAGNGHPMLPSQEGLYHSCSFCDEQHVHTGGELADIWQDYSLGLLNFDANAARESVLYLDNNSFHFTACQDCLLFYLTTKFEGSTNDWALQSITIPIMIENMYGKNFYEHITAPHRWEEVTLANGCCTTYCIDCGYVHSVSHSRGEIFSENGCCMTRCLCGYEYEIPHVGNFTYFGKPNFHTTTCLNCSATYQEQHAYALGIEGCILCGYGAPIGGGIIIKGAN